MYVAAAGSVFVDSCRARGAAELTPGTDKSGMTEIVGSTRISISTAARRRLCTCCAPKTKKASSYLRRAHDSHFA